MARPARKKGKKEAKVEDSDSSSASSASDEEDAQEDKDDDLNEKSLLKLSKADLEAMARRIKVAGVEQLVKQSKKNIVEEILKKAATAKKEVVRSTAAHPDAKVWLSALEIYVGKTEIPHMFSWANPKCLLFPPLWLILFWLCPPSDSEIFAILGGPGGLVRSLKDRWKELLQIDDNAVKDLADHFTSLYTSITNAHTRVSDTTDSCMVIEQWLERSWKMHVSPALVQCRLAQANLVHARGHEEIASKLVANALMPLENFSADVAAVIKKQMEKAPSAVKAAAPTRHAPPSAAGSQQNPIVVGPKFKCFKCKKQIAIKTGQVRRDAVTEHRKTCK